MALESKMRALMASSPRIILGSASGSRRLVGDKNVVGKNSIQHLMILNACDRRETTISMHEDAPSAHVILWLTGLMSAGIKLPYVPTQRSWTTWPRNLDLPTKSARPTLMKKRSGMKIHISLSWPWAGTIKAMVLMNHMCTLKMPF